MPNAIPLGLHLVIQLLREGPDPDGLVLLIDASGNREIELQAADLLREKILGPLFIVREDLRLDLGADHLHQFAQLASLCGLVELALRDLYGDLHAALPASFFYVEDKDENAGTPRGIVGAKEKGDAEILGHARTGYGEMNDAGKIFSA